MTARTIHINRARLVVVTATARRTGPRLISVVARPPPEDAMAKSLFSPRARGRECLTTNEEESRRGEAHENDI
jgi:hypothetical protein